MQSVSAIRRHNVSYSYILYFLLPLIVALFPAVFHYANNSAIAPVSDLTRLLAVFTGVAILVYILFGFAIRQHAVQTATAASVFLLFFHSYGLVFNGLRAWDGIRVDYFTFLPLYILIGFQLALFMSRFSVKRSYELWRGALLILGALLVFNLVKTVSAQVRVDRVETTSSTPIPAVSSNAASYPDIYYFMFDEMAGFEVMRQYWNSEEEVDEFVAFLKSKGFFIAEQSHGDSIETLYEMAQRFNYEKYPPYDRTKKSFYHEDAANGRIFPYLKSLGYTTVAFDEKRSAFGFPAGPPMDVDYLYEESMDTVATQGVGVWDEFTLLVLDNTMLQPLVTDIKLSSPQVSAEQHKNMVLFTGKKVAQLDDIPAPKFVYVHLMLPHVPYMFKADGSLVSPSGYYDWNNYLGNYQFTLSFIRQVITDVLASANPAHPPVIIIQSDHGARNIDYGLGMLSDYQDDYKSFIVNAMYLPGYDTSELPQDFDPINTFPLIFNHYFKADLPIVE